MKKRNFTVCSRILASPKAAARARKFEKRARSRARRRVDIEDLRAFEKTTGAWGVA